MKSYRPTTPSQRHTTVVSYRNTVTSAEPEKSLTTGFRRGSGRNHHGRITTRHKGGGHKRRYRFVDFKQDKMGIPARVESVEYDPNRSSFIALVVYADGEKRYIIAPQKLEVGQTVTTGSDVPSTAGNRTELKNLPIGTFVYAIELKPGAGAQIARSAGAYAEIIARDGGYVSLKLPSSEIRKVKENCFASVGEVSNQEHKLRSIGKAGRARHLGRRPTVRGMAMNPVDHPMGGGEARGRGRRKHKKTKWGKVVDPGKKTRQPKKYSDHLIVSRRKTKRRK